MTNETITAQDKKHLLKLIKKEMRLNGPNCDLNHIDVSSVEDMSCIFSYSEFNGDISKWAVEKVESMNFMFYNSKFNGDLTNWKPYRADIEHIFLNANIELPYWAEINDREERNLPSLLKIKSIY
jgi:hypothetical protein